MLVNNIGGMNAAQMPFGQVERVTKKTEYKEYAVGKRKEIKCEEQHFYYNVPSTNNNLHLTIRDITNASTKEKEKWIFVEVQPGELLSNVASCHYAMKYDGEKLVFAGAYTNNPCYGADLDHDGFSTWGKNKMLSILDPIIKYEKQNLQSEKNQEESKKIKERIKILEHAYNGTKLMQPSE